MNNNTKTEEHISKKQLIKTAKDVLNQFLETDPVALQFLLSVNMPVNSQPSNSTENLVVGKVKIADKEVDIFTAMSLVNTILYRLTKTIITRETQQDNIIRRFEAYTTDLKDKQLNIINLVEAEEDSVKAEETPVKKKTKRQLKKEQDAVLLEEFRQRMRDQDKSGLLSSEHRKSIKQKTIIEILEEADKQLPAWFKDAVKEASKGIHICTAEEEKTFKAVSQIQTAIVPLQEDDNSINCKEVLNIIHGQITALVAEFPVNWSASGLKLLIEHNAGVYNVNVRVFAGLH